MPLFDFECRACQNRYEAMSRFGEAHPPCPACGGADIEKVPGLGTLRTRLPDNFTWENPRFRGQTHTSKKVPK